MRYEKSSTARLIQKQDRDDKCACIADNKQSLGIIIRNLMRECGNISEAELARQTSLPQATVNRVLLGGTTDPRASTIKTIARFFHVSVDQLLGEDPIDQLRIRGTHNPSKEATQAIPIIKWDDAIKWDTLKNEINSVNFQDWVVLETNLDKNAFALKSIATLEPTFPKDSLLIFNPTKNYVDGSYVLVSINNNIALKKIIISDQVYLEHVFNRNIQPILLDKNYKIIGYLVETRIYF